jgi:hypothetical protein
MMTAALHEVEAIARSIVDTKLADTVEEFSVTEQTEFEPVDPDADAGLSLDIAKPGEPVDELGRFANFDHVQTIVCTRRLSSARQQ